MTDIRFDGDFIHLEGLVVRATANDLMLDATARRRTNTPFRRALVHDFDDGLTLNWDSDYPGGVSVNSCKQILGFNNRDWLIVRSRIMQQFGTDFMLDGGPDRRGRLSTSLRRNPFRRALVHGPGDQLVLNWDRDYTGGVVVNGRVTMPDGAVVAGQDVAATLTTLAGQVTSLTTQLTAATAAIADLTARVTALESEVTT
ncbi:hypothetical protein H1W00_01495 [Aeromicrobium sp. Marseille-Q0843]|uniref:Uncharacterized protein n=1 Tax=Aeromicrobium phoceense TaxID=2754045 RepID=A0A838XEC6_9ACTN|nr:hypothetical protein [Aeromicrobium phoceense]MBA4607148.1 hypothetical protein [Aeromicrobium phoceense]